MSDYQTPPEDSGLEAKRRQALVDAIMSPAVQVPENSVAQAEPARLGPAQLEDLFIKHVPGVRDFTYQHSGQRSLGFVMEAYANGIQKFRGTELHGHYLSLLREIVHHGYNGGAGAAKYLKDVAEAFKDCQDVQARVVESVGLRLRGVTLDFRGHMVQLISHYKRTALMMLSVQHTGSMNTIHFENWLGLEVGDKVGLDRADIRRARHDREVGRRFHKMGDGERYDFTQRLKRIFDVDALIRAVVAEVNAYGVASAPDSLPCQFLNWAQETMWQPHAVFDDTCSTVCVDYAFALAITEVLFLGKTSATDAEMRGEVRLRDLFKSCDSSSRL